MPELVFKGKEYVRNHHLTVPYRPLVPDAEKSVGDPDLGGNLIIHGDNLHALKALLPRYAGKVDVIFIDPPYNTGNEGWSYSDNVNSPYIKEWLSGNPVNAEDMLRHDKWCCMMWPRLRMLYELLAEQGVLCVTIDDNEVHRLGAMLDELFGEANQVATFIWRKVDSPNDNKVTITPDHEFVLAYTKTPGAAPIERRLDDSILRAYRQRDDDGHPCRDRLLKKNGRNSLRRDRPTMWFKIPDPDGNDVWPIHDNGEEACWSKGETEVLRLLSENKIVWKRRLKGSREVWEPYTRERAPGEPFRPWMTIWNDLPTMRQAKAMLRDIFATADTFATPKPVELIERILTMFPGIGEAPLILDSFAGSATTAHAVLAANARDDRHRRFILVECEEYADTVTAERVRSVARGYHFTGTQRETLLEKRLTWTELKRAATLLEDVENTRRLHEGDFDEIETKVADGVLRVVGIRNVAETAPGLGGSFTYCTLGDPVELDALLRGENLPDREALGDWLLYTATGTTAEASGATGVPANLAEHFLAETAEAFVWLVYRPDPAWLQSRDAALTLDLAQALTAWRNDRRHLVFAPARYVGDKTLRDHKLQVGFAPLPYSLYRLERD